MTLLSTLTRQAIEKSAGALEPIYERAGRNPLGRLALVTAARALDALSESAARLLGTDGSEAPGTPERPSQPRSEPSARPRSSDPAEHKTAGTGAADVVDLLPKAAEPHTVVAPSGSAELDAPNDVEAPATSPRVPPVVPAPQATELALLAYDGLLAGEVINRLDGLSLEELAEIHAYEKLHDGRITILQAIESHFPHPDS